jgi:hypothetical protein
MHLPYQPCLSVSRCRRNGNTFPPNISDATHSVHISLTAVTAESISGPREDNREWGLWLGYDCRSRGCHRLANRFTFDQAWWEMIKCRVTASPRRRLLAPSISGSVVQVRSGRREGKEIRRSSPLIRTEPRRRTRTHRRKGVVILTWAANCLDSILKVPLVVWGVQRVKRSPSELHVRMTAKCHTSAFDTRIHENEEGWSGTGSLWKCYHAISADADDSGPWCFLQRLGIGTIEKSEMGIIGGAVRRPSVPAVVRLASRCIVCICRPGPCCCRMIGLPQVDICLSLIVSESLVRSVKCVTRLRSPDRVGFPGWGSTAKTPSIGWGGESTMTR